MYTKPPAQVRTSYEAYHQNRTPLLSAAELIAASRKYCLVALFPGTSASEREHWSCAGGESLCAGVPEDSEQAKEQR